MSIALLLIDDGREDYLVRCRRQLETVCPSFTQTIEVLDPDHVLGFAGAIQRGWSRVLETDAEFVFHVESDFSFNAAVPLARMIGLLERRPYLAQVSLKRQAWNADELAAGGIVEAHPDNYTECSDGPTHWTEHRRYFTTTPSLYRREICDHGWPQAPDSEGIFTHELLADPELKFAIWGAKFEAPMVEHIGKDRAGVGY